jgi:putative colanic acid biosynthesis UDP-glucose lipid carrier transferase
MCAASTATRTLRLTTVSAATLSLEFVIVASSAYLASDLYHLISLQPQPPISQSVPAAIYLAALVLGISIGFRHFEAVQRQPLHLLLWNGLGAVGIALSLFLSTLFLLKGTEEYSRGAFVLQIVAVMIAVCLTRVMFYFWLQSSIRAGLVTARHVVLIGDDFSAQRFGELVRTTAIRGIAWLPFPLHPNLSNRGDCDQLVDSEAVRQTIESCRSARPDDVVIFASPEELPAAPELARMLSELPVSVHIVPYGSINFFGTSRIGELGDLKTLEVARPPLSAFERTLKRTFDVLIAAAGLILLAPLFGIVALAIKLESRGRILYWQERHGYNNTVIRVAKFRSMIANVQENDRFIQATRNDARVTRIGRILRQTNIDELPQLINVLMGTMSIVGPRPHATAHNQMFEGRILPFSRRHNIKPGITGWAQVNGYRGETDTLEKMQRRVEHDLYYIDNWSFLLDIKIILLTLFSRRAYRNAY